MIWIPPTLKTKFCGCFTGRWKVLQPREGKGNHGRELSRITIQFLPLAFLVQEIGREHLLKGEPIDAVRPIVVHASCYKESFNVMCLYNTQETLKEKLTYTPGGEGQATPLSHHSVNARSTVFFLGSTGPKKIQVDLSKTQPRLRLQVAGRKILRPMCQRRLRWMHQRR